MKKLCAHIHTHIEKYSTSEHELQSHWRQDKSSYMVKNQMCPFCLKMNPIQKLSQVMGRSNILSQPFRNHLSVESNFEVATGEKLSIYMVCYLSPLNFFSTNYMFYKTQSNCGNPLKMFTANWKKIMQQLLFYHCEKKFNKWWSTIPPMSTKQTITSHLNHWT